ncbi:homologous recombination OB-fold protein isoform X1 [Heptranchias perlo]|uniref:homologous recombination OB-fold protein isoform X1 n=1 Tax=Heptranchias perlo TaxID=212740 RepID=UPI00355A2265
MACSFQKLFSVGEEFDDDDLLSAVLDAENAATSSSGTSPCVGLRPIASVLRTPASSCCEPKILPHSAAGQRYCQSDYDTTSVANDDLTKKTLAASIDASLKLLPWLNNPSNKQNSTPAFKFVSKAQQKNPTKVITEVGSSEEIDLFWPDCEELSEAGNVQNSELRETSSPTFCERRLSTSGIVPSPIYPRDDHAILSAKLPRLSGGHEKADNGKSGNSKVAAACTNGQERIVLNDSENASKMFKFFNHPSSGFNQSPASLSNTNTDAVAMRNAKISSDQVIDSHGYSAARSNAVLRTELSSHIPSNIRTAKELLTPVPQNLLGKNMLGNAISPCKLVSPSLQSQSAQHQQISSTALRNCPNPILLRPETALQNSLIPRLSKGGLRRPIMSTSEPRTLMCAIESPSVAVGTQYSPAANSGSVGTPVTNHLIQLVSAANRTPDAAKSDRPRTKRRFPGPAGILPQQHLGKNLDEVLISAPQMPTHGAVPKLQPQEVPNSQQSVEDDFGRGPWAAMKAELRLDEQDTGCFLRSYSIVMVLRKAALKQLPKGKVPNMAVLVKSLTRTNTDASAVFKDPSGEMQGTIHRQLLVEQPNDLKVGTVLLLKQVGVFSPSLRNHYLNITPSNVIRIYPQGASECFSSQLDQSPQKHIALLQQSTFNFVAKSPYDPRCSDSLITNKNSCTDTTSWDPQTLPSSTGKENLEISGCKGTVLQGHCEDDWEADGLDCLMAELPEEFFSTL